MKSKKYAIALCILLTSCGQSFNSNTNDTFLIQSSFCADQSNTTLCAANEVIQTKCTSCHEGYHDQWLALDTDDKWKQNSSAGIIPGNPGSSTIITKLKDNGGNMPPSGEELSDDEQQAVRDWITAL